MNIHQLIQFIRKGQLPEDVIERVLTQISPEAIEASNELMTFLEILEARKRSDYKAMSEASLTRIMQKFNSVKDEGKTMAIFTPWKAQDAQGKVIPNKVNRAEHGKLSASLQTRGFSFTKVMGHGKWCADESLTVAECPEELLRQSAEPSFVVMDMTRKEVIEIMKKHGQNSVLYAGPDTGGKMHLLWANGSSEVAGGGAFHAGRLAQYMSKVQGRPFTFEWLASNWSEQIMEIQYG